MTSTSPFNPFPGLRPFRESEAHLFFGRSSHVDELLAELVRSRFVAVMGASGSGKSSLVTAGLLPALHGGFAPRVGSHWRIATCRPGASPIQNLARALGVPEVLGAQDVEPLLAEAQVEATLRRSGFGLADAAQRGGSLGDGRLLIVVDQFEELFRFHATAIDRGAHADAGPFVQLLIEATRDDGPVDVIVTMRSDFLGDCSQFRELPEAINRGLYLVPRLTRSQLREAITAPAAVGGATLSPRLVQRLLNDAGADPDMLPVVQHAMMRTWDTWVRDGRPVSPIDVEHYEACGGLEAALSRHADEAYFGLAEGPPRSIAELIFKRITELGEDRRETRRPTSLSELAAVADATPAEIEGCIGHFEEQGRSFVNVSTDGVVDLSHESLIRQWPRLRTWVRQEVDSRDVYRRVADAADRWGRGEAALLQGPDLQIATQWWTANQPNQAWADRYNPAFEPAARYLARSRRAARRRRAGAAAGVAALAILALVAVLFALRADQQKNVAEHATAEAQRQRRTAVSRQLASSSVAEGAASRSVSLLTAVEAVRVTEVDGLRIPVAEEALRQALRDPLGLNLSSGPAQRGPVGPVTAVAFSPDGSMLATGSDDGTARLWSLAEPGAPPRILERHEDGITTLAFSDDGKWLATGSDDGTARLWDLGEPALPARILDRHEDGITALAFSVDGTWLATASRDEDVLLWSVDDQGAEPHRLRGHGGFVLSLAFSPDGTRLVTGGGDDVALVWSVDDVATDPLVLRGHADDVGTVAFSPDGQSVATGSRDNTARLWDLTGTGRAVVLPHGGAVNALAFSADGRWLATGSGDATARLWKLRDSADPAADPVVLQHPDVVEAVAFSGSGHRLATGSRDNTGRIFDLDDLSSVPVVLGGHEGSVKTLAFSLEDRWLATGSNDGTARLWDLDHLATRPSVLHHTSVPEPRAVRVTTLAFSPDGRRLATGTSDKTVRLWDVDDLSTAPVVLVHETVVGFERAGITALAFSSDGQWLATGSGDMTVRLWDLDDPTPDPALVSAYRAAVTALAFSPDGRWLAVGVKDDVAFLSAISDSAAPPRPLTGHHDEVTSVAFSPDGRWLATGSRDKTVRLWALGDLDAEPDDLRGDAPVTSLAFSPDGRQLAIGGTDAAVSLWDVENDDPTVGDDLNAGGPVTGVAYSPDGRTLVVAAGRTVELWDLAVPDPAISIANPTILRDHSRPVNAVAYSPDGGRFASAGDDGTARVWLPLPALIDLGCRNVGRNLTQAEWRQFLPDERYRRTCGQWPPGP